MGVGIPVLVLAQGVSDVGGRRGHFCPSLGEQGLHVQITSVAREDGVVSVTAWEKQRTLLTRAVVGE